jgi:protein SCO1/2
MRKAVAIAALLLAVACANEKKAAPKPLSVPGEKVYDVRGKILARDDRENSLKIDHEAIPGFMEAMTMDYTVRGAKVASMPANNSTVVAKLHVTDDSYWITDVRAAARP